MAKKSAKKTTVKKTAKSSTSKSKAKPPKQQAKAPAVKTPPAAPSASPDTDRPLQSILESKLWTAFLIPLIAALIGGYIVRQHVAQASKDLVLEARADAVARDLQELLVALNNWDGALGPQQAVKLSRQGIPQEKWFSTGQILGDLGPRWFVALMAKGDGFARDIDFDSPLFNRVATSGDWRHFLDSPEEREQYLGAPDIDLTDIVIHLTDEGKELAEHLAATRSYDVEIAEHWSTEYLPMDASVEKRHLVELLWSADEPQ
ncbi:MAG: hypothetical protein JSU94_12080 [Phycisphaerales bacterium]|nr:MAG: hypothetical protein JSU94_12080 [Phycisphaerales bacterium]